MKTFSIKSLCVCACVLAFTFAANAQGAAKGGDSVGVAVMKGTGKAAVIVVGSAGKVVWGTTKFAAKHFAKPVFLKLAPAVTSFSLKLAGKATKQGFKSGAKLSVAYLKTKLP